MGMSTLVCGFSVLYKENNRLCTELSTETVGNFIEKIIRLIALKAFKNKGLTKKQADLIK